MRGRNSSSSSTANGSRSDIPYHSSTRSSENIEYQSYVTNFFKFKTPVDHKSKNPLFYSLMQRANKYYEKNNYTAAMQDVCTALKIEPNDLAALSIRSDIYVLIEDYAAAILDTKKILEIYPDNGSAYYRLGNIYYRQYNFAEAIENLHLARAKGCRSEHVDHCLIAVYFKTRNYVQAREELDYLSAKPGNKYNLIHKRAMLNILEDKDVDANQDIGLILKTNPKDAGGLSLKGYLEIKLKNFDKALRYFSAAFCLQATYTRIHLLKFLELTSSIDENIIPIIRQIIRNFNDNKNISKEGLITICEIKKIISDFSDLIDDYSSLCELEPDNDTYLAKRGMTWLKLDNRESAEADFKSSLEINPENKIALEGLSRMEPASVLHTS